MKLLHKDTMAELWRKAKPIIRKGIKYYIGRMNYGDYFLEPYPPKGERERFKKGTHWIPKYKLSH